MPNWSWLFGLLCLFFWSNLCADATQRQLFAQHYGKFSGFSYGTQQSFYLFALLTYFVPSMLGYQTTISMSFELMSLFYFAVTEATFWVKQNFRWATLMQLLTILLLISGLACEFIIGSQDMHYKLLYIAMRLPLLFYFIFYFVSIQSFHQTHGPDKAKFYRESGRFSDFNSVHINANALFVPSDVIVPRTDLFKRVTIKVQS